jgi:hypothetical protein
MLDLIVTTLLLWGFQRILYFTYYSSKAKQNTVCTVLLKILDTTLVVQKKKRLTCEQKKNNTRCMPCHAYKYTVCDKCHICFPLSTR